MMRKPNLAAPARRRLIRVGVRVLLPALAGIALVLQSGAFGGSRQPGGPSAGAPSAAPAPVILGTRG